MQNVYYFRYDGALLAGDLIVMTDCASFLDAAYADLNAGISADYTYTQVRGFNVTQNVPMPTVSWPAQTSGGGGNVSTAAGVAMLVLFRTGISRVFGRKYIGALISNDLDTDGMLTTSLVTLGTVFAANFLQSFTGPTSLAQFLPGIISSTGQFWGFIESVVTNNPAYQRRRRKGRGV